MRCFIRNAISQNCSFVFCFFIARVELNLRYIDVFFLIWLFKLYALLFKIVFFRHSFNKDQRRNPILLIEEELEDTNGANWRRTDNTLAKIKSTNYDLQNIHIKLNIELFWVMCMITIYWNHKIFYKKKTIKNNRPFAHFPLWVQIYTFYMIISL